MSILSILQARSRTDELVKLSEAKLRTDLLPHQKRVVKKMDKMPGLVVAHGTGSGKTLSSIASAVNSKDAKVLVPAALKKNYEKEIEKHVEGDPDINVQSIQQATNQNTPIKNNLLIVDEAHRLRNPGTAGHKYVSDKGGKKMLLTASPLYNRPEDIAPLVNLAAGKRQLPQGSDFRRRYIKEPDKDLITLINPRSRKEPVITNKRELSGVLNKWVDYHKGQEEGFPDLEEKRIDVPMTQKQTRLHDMAWNELPLLTKMRMKKGLPPNKKDLASINEFQSQARQISSSTSRFSKEDMGSTPKIRKAVENLKMKLEKDPEHKAVAYAHYLSPLEDYRKELENEGIPYISFTGKQGKKVRDQGVEEYNRGDKKVLLASSSGGEGLDLKGTRQVQVLEPHWNEEKLKQVIGRARRLGSHSHLPKEKQKVEVERYASIPKTVIKKRKGIDSILYDTAAQKDRLNEQIVQLLKSGQLPRPEGWGLQGEMLRSHSRLD